jgi:Cu2+-exporting ATPase
LEKDANPIHLNRIESVTGAGIKAFYKDSLYVLGTEKLLYENSLQLPHAIVVWADQKRAEAKTIVFYATSEKVLAAIAIADKIKKTSAEAISNLKARGIDVYMLTGDNQKTAAAVANETGIIHFKAEVLPIDKYNFIKQLQEEGKVVAMVGDGINDSQALAQADLSIAMAHGSDIAIDVAKMTLMSSDLSRIPAALNLSKKTSSTIKQNLFWAFIYNVIGIPVAAGLLFPINGFLLNPMIAGAAMALSSVSVVTNSLRLKWSRL